VTFSRDDVGMLLACLHADTSAPVRDWMRIHVRSSDEVRAVVVVLASLSAAVIRQLAPEGDVFGVVTAPGLNDASALVTFYLNRDTEEAHALVHRLEREKCLGCVAVELVELAHNVVVSVPFEGEP